MKNIAIIVLSVLLAVALVFGFILYKRHLDTKDSLLISEKNLSELNEKVSHLNQEISKFQDQDRKNAERLKELEAAQVLISKLEKAITMKDQIISEFEKTTRTLEQGLEKEKKANENLKAELASREAIITELQEGVQGFQSNIIYLEEEIAKEHNEIEGLHRELSYLEGQKVIVETKIGQLKSTYEALVSKRLKELQNAQARISELSNAINIKDQTLSEFEETLRTLESELEQEKKSKDAIRTELASKNALITQLQERVQGTQSNILYMEEEVARYQNETEGLEGKLLALKGEKATAEAKTGQLKSTYEALISDLKQQIENQEVNIKSFEEKISVTFVDRILFEFGKATITPKGKMILERVGGILKKVQDRKIRVVGHSDNRPILPGYQHKFPSNWELSSARAAAVVRHFQKTTGLDPSNLEAVGRSFYDPVASNETAEGRAQNRRVEIIIAPKIE